MIEFDQIALSNQPSFHIPYLFTYAKRPDLTQLLVKQTCSRFFDEAAITLPTRKSVHVASCNNTVQHQFVAGLEWKIVKITWKYHL